MSASISSLAYSSDYIATVAQTCRRLKTKLVLSIDVGVRNLALWMGCVDMPDQSQCGYAASLEDVRFFTVFWMHASCPKLTKVTPTAQITRVLEQHYDSALKHAHSVVIERQHKKNTKMKYFSRVISSFFRKRGHRSVCFRFAWKKFETVAWLPSPMPTKKCDRKRSAERATQEALEYAVRNNGPGARLALSFFNELRVQRHDVSDALLMGMDYLIDDKYTLPKVARSDTAYTRMEQAIYNRVPRKKTKKRAKRKRTNSASIFKSLPLSLKALSSSSSSSFKSHSHGYDEFKLDIFSKNPLSLNVSDDDNDDDKPYRKRRKYNLDLQ
jgi:hypothetical protein